MIMMKLLSSFSMEMSFFRVTKHEPTRTDQNQAGTDQNQAETDQNRAGTDQETF